MKIDRYASLLPTYIQRKHLASRRNSKIARIRSRHIGNDENTRHERQSYRGAKSSYHHSDRREKASLSIETYQVRSYTRIIKESLITAEIIQPWIRNKIRVQTHLATSSIPRNMI